MNQALRNHANWIVRETFAAVQPDIALKHALQHMDFLGKVLLLSAGKAGWQMAKAASDCLESRIENGTVITKYGHITWADCKLFLLRSGASRAG